MTLTAEQVRAQLPDLARAAEDADGVAPLSEQTLLTARRGQASDDTTSARGTEGTDEGEPAMVWHDVDGELIAIAISDASRTSYELVVHPAHRRHGYGASLLDLVVNEHSPGARVWAHGDLPAARSLATSHGLRVVRELWMMARPVLGEPAIAEPSLPTGFASRHLVPGADDEAWLAVNARAFAHHPEQGRMTLADLQERMQQDWFDPRGLLLIEDVSGQDPVLAASHWTKIEPPGAAEGEVYVVAVDPAYQGLGLGRAVTALGLAHLAAAGVRTIDLYVEGDNAPAIATYRGWGFEKASADVMYTL
ncbi:mycothiol synthase [Allobranchiibius sp. CTAmp26]|uniref:mycothiol synthase n=1 Tax=Allobranchiibius sp. CTAmp26 TaxID=2815214 RepID=UPI001AA0E62D|nr:mycothiol synthase [Allobranchiibius sp. CTAmp26]MBO1753800.1 mycothiol synthase [Allobranchiibius sp. CTAmp26]